MAEVKCPSCGAFVEVSVAAGTCPFCGGAIGIPAAAPAGPSSEPVPSAPPPENREERMAELMKKYEEAMTRGDHEAAAGFMEEYLRTAVTGMPGFETKDKVEAFVAESMKTFRQAIQSTEPAGTPGEEAPDADDGTILTKDSPTTEHASKREAKEGEESGKRGFMGKLKSLRDKLGDVIDADDIIDDAKDVFGG
mgnify:CR=1 FL=1